MDNLRRGSVWKNAIISAAIVLAAIALYQSNDDTYLYTYDSAPNSLLTLNVLENHRADFENFRGGYLYGFGASYVFSNAKDGRLTSFFPIGAALLSAPLYLAFDAQLHAARHAFDITSIAFERQRLHYEKQAANVIAAFAAVLLFFSARRIGGPLRAIVVTIFFAAGTDMWTLSSQALWQHGPINLVVLALIFALISAVDASTPKQTLGWLFVAGVCAGFLPVIRPTAAIFLIAAAGFSAWEFRWRTSTFAVAVICGIAPGIAWNEVFFGTLGGGYQTMLSSYSLTFGQFVDAFPGLLFSPGRGLFVYSPLIAFSIIGIWYAARSTRAYGRLLVWFAAASIVLTLSYGFFLRWPGGTCFGYRYLCDLAGIAALLLVFVIPAAPLAFVRRGAKEAAFAAAFGVFFTWSIGVQFVGANGEMESEWSAVPMNVDFHPARLWAIRDSPIERDAYATFYKFAPNPTTSASYAAHFEARIRHVEATGLGGEKVLHARPKVNVDVIATVQNNGTAPIFGYDTGYWVGQTRLRAEIERPGGQVVGEGVLYVKGTVPPGESGPAFGTIRAPAAAGDYVVTLTPELNRLQIGDSPGSQRLVAPLRVASQIERAGRLLTLVRPELAE